MCGDGFVDSPETCDDQNTTPGDGCSAICQKEPKVLAYPAAFPALGQSVAAGDFVLYQITGLTAGMGYAVSTRNAANDLDLYVYDDAGLTMQSCRAATLSGNESCTATPTTDQLNVVVRSFASASTSFTLDVAPSTTAVDGGATGG